MPDHLHGIRVRPEGWSGARMLKKGDKLDNYEIMALLGAGGFGCVWRAKDLTVKGRQVAIKELTDPTPERIEGFLREMEILASLHHPGIVTFARFLERGRLVFYTPHHE